LFKTITLLTNLVKSDSVNLITLFILISFYYKYINYQKKGWDSPERSETGRRGIRTTRLFVYHFYNYRNSKLSSKQNHKHLIYHNFFFYKDNKRFSHYQKKGWDSPERSESGPGGIRISPPIKKVWIKLSNLTFNLTKYRHICN
jgi:hypothetical protein